MQSGKSLNKIDSEFLKIYDLASTQNKDGLTHLIESGAVIDEINNRGLTVANKLLSEGRIDKAAFLRKWFGAKLSVEKEKPTEEKVKETVKYDAHLVTFIEIHRAVVNDVNTATFFSRKNKSADESKNKQGMYRKLLEKHANRFA